MKFTKHDLAAAAQLIKGLATLNPDGDVKCGPTDPGAHEDINAWARAGFPPLPKADHEEPTEKRD